MIKKVKLLLICILFFLGTKESFAINISNSTTFNISKEIQYILTGVSSNPNEEVTLTGSYNFGSVVPGYCVYRSGLNDLYFKTKSYLNTYSSYNTIISSDNSNNSWSTTNACNTRINRSGYYDSGIPKDFFYYNLPYGDSNTVFDYNSDGNLTIQKSIGVNQYSSLTFSSKYFLYNNVYVSYGSNNLSYYYINYNDLTTSQLDTRPYPSGFLEPSYIPFPFVDIFGEMKGWIYSCKNNTSVCFLSANGNYFREVIINSAGKLVGPLMYNSSNTKYIFSSDLGNNVIVYNTTFNETGTNIDLVEFDSIRNGDGSLAIYFSGITLDTVGNYDVNLNRVYLKDFNNFKSSSDDKVYYYDLNCNIAGYTSVSYFANDNKFYCASSEGNYSIQASDGYFYPSSCYEDIVNGGFVCDSTIKSPNHDLAYNPLTGENAGHITITTNNTGNYNTPLNGLGVAGCDYFENVNNCNNGEYLAYNNGILVCGSIGTPLVCDNQCKAYLYGDSRLCATDVLNGDNTNNPPSSSGSSNPDLSDNSKGFFTDLFNSIFGVDENKITDLNKSLSGAMSKGTNGFSMGTGGTSQINFTLGNNDYGTILNRNNSKKTCDMFNHDGSFAYYSNGSYDLSVNLNNILNLSYVDKVPFIEELLYIPNKLLGFITNPLQNILSTLRVFGGIGENTYCYFGTLQTIEFQKYIKIGTSFFGGEINIIPGTLTIIDYLILFFMGLPFLFVTYKLLLY